jgi:hypothetical protein
MTARPIDPKSRRRPVYAAVALVLAMVAVLLAAGCIGSDYKSDQDIHLIKLNQDGSVAWTKVIDTGKDDEVNDIIQTSDGGYIVAGGYSIPQCNQHTHRPTTAILTRFSSEGKILWEQNDHENIIAVFQIPDSGFLIFSQDGMIEQLDSNGNIQWNRTISDKKALQMIINSAIRTKDDGYIISGTAVCCDLTLPKNYTMMVTKLDQNANQSWINIYNDSKKSSVDPLIELDNNSGSIGLLRYFHELVLLNNNGTISGYIPINTSGTYDPYKIQAVPGGFFVYQRNWSSDGMVEELRFNNEGKPMGSRLLFNITHENDVDSPKSDETLLIKDQGYLTIIPDRFTGRPLDSGRFNARARLLTANGSIIWDRGIMSLPVKNYPGNHVRRIIETDDGGFLVVFGVEKAIDC